MHGCLGCLGGGPSCEHYMQRGLAIRSEWGMGGTVLRILRTFGTPDIYVVVIGVYIGR
jgi:hypothetical protein